jgi:hypothetical protein
VERIAVSRPDDRAEWVGAAIDSGDPGECFQSGEPVMTKRVILAGILGGILLFNWGFVAHMVLPIGEMGVHMLPDEAAVVGTIRSTVKGPGFYVFPGMDMSGKASESEQQAWAERAKQGPVGVLIVRPQGSEFVMGPLLLTELGTNIVSSLLAALLLSQVRVGASYWTRVGLVTLLGLFAFVTVVVPYWNWYSFPADFVASEAIEHVVGWFVAGLAMAAIVRAPKSKIAE